jgi:tRNA pseudouridine38-40 synthase
MRYFFEISYKGTAYSGWQSQKNATGVQTVVEESMCKLLREDINIVCSGRTDAGVHCAQQFFHADIQQSVNTVDLVHRLNSFLPKDIAIHGIYPVKPEANARYDAIERMYVYKIVRKRNVFTPGFAWYFFKPLDISTMITASSLLIGKHDFKCFSKVKTDVNHFICTIFMAEWEEDGDFLIFKIAGNRFLRGMVRAIVGTLVDIGEGKTTIDKFREILQSGDRRSAGANVPPEGLYLTRVRYPETIFEKSKFEE